MTLQSDIERYKKHEYWMTRNERGMLRTILLQQELLRECKSALEEADAIFKGEWDAWDNVARKLLAKLGEI